MKLEGTVRQADVGLGQFVLETADGRRFALLSDDEGLLQDGQQVSLEGEVREDVMGIGMTGDPTLEVRGFRVI